MRIDLERLKQHCAERHLTLSELLESAGVSRNAFYSLSRRESVLPGSIRALAEFLQIPPAEFLVDEGSNLQQGLALQSRIDEIANRHRTVNRDTIRHTLILLDEKPLERLRRALLRAGAIDIQHQGDRLSH